MNKVLFKEEQQFRQWWYIVLVLVATVPVIFFSVYALIQQTVNGVPVGNTPAPNGVHVGLIIFLGALLWLFFSLKLKVWIDQDGIHYSFFPLIFRKRLISVHEIQRCEIRHYRPILEYGGWGIKKSFKWGRAYNVSGNVGLQLYLKNGKKVLFGTHRPQAMMHALESAMTSKNQV